MPQERQLLPCPLNNPQSFLFESSIAPLEIFKLLTYIDALFLPWIISCDQQHQNLKQMVRGKTKNLFQKVN